MKFSSRTDLETWAQDYCGALGFDEAEQERIVEALQAADHPSWGADWEAWLSHTLPDVIEDEFGETYMGLVEDLRRNDADRERQQTVAHLRKWVWGAS